MYRVGCVIDISGQLFAIVDAFAKSVLAYPCRAESGTFVLDFASLTNFTHEELDKASPQMIGSLPPDMFESAKRQQIFGKVEEFYSLFHQKEPFVPGESNLSYAGKVYDHREMIALTDAMLDFWLTSGRFTEKFEYELAKRLGVRHVRVTNSGSSSNLIALSALTSPKLEERRLRPGDEVITVAAGFPTTIAPIVQNRLIPVFVDVELGTYNVNPDLLEQAISPKTRAIMMAHTMGNPFNLDVVMRLAKKYNLWVVEDNCDALGSKYNGQFTGTFGDIGTSSYYPPHHITMGEGGAVYTNQSILKVILESFRDWGRDCWCPSGCDNTCGKRFDWQLGQLPQGYDHKYTYSHLGYNLKATDLQVAIGLEQLNKLDAFTARRVHNFERLKQNLGMLHDVLVLPEATSNSEPSWFGFILTVRDGQQISRNKMTQYLQDHRIQTRMLFAGNITRQPAFEGVEYRQASQLSITDKIMNDTFLVGVYPGLTDEMIDYISENIVEAVKCARN